MAKEVMALHQLESHYGVEIGYATLQSAKLVTHYIALAQRVSMQVL